MADITVLTIFRFLHITAGVIWAGTLMYLAFFILPAVKAAGAEGGKFMQVLSGTRHFPKVMTTVAGTNVLSGLVLYDYFSSHFSAAFISTPHGTVMTIGGLSALIAFSIGLTVNRPTVNKMAALGKTIATSGQPPTPEQMQLIGSYRATLTKATNIVASLLAVTVVMMSIMKYI